MSDYRVSISLLACESVVDSGTRKTSWLIYVDGVWQTAQDYPDAKLESVDAGPGTIWQSRVELRLVPGTWLQRVESSPLPVRDRDPMSYLRKETRAAGRRVVRTYYRVTRTGELKRPPKTVTPP